MQVECYSLKDRLTNLPYYDEFITLASQCLKEQALPEGMCFAVVVSDMSNFKYINQMYGHEKGDLLLQTFARIVAEENSSCYVACRPYSDHILGLYCASKDRIAYQERIMDTTMRIIAYAKTQFPMMMMHVNTGIYMIEDVTESLASCVDKANIARRHGKGDYSRDYVFFEDSMLEERETSAHIMSIFDRIPHEELIQVYLQPKFCVPQGELVGMEALSRMRDVDGKLISPGIFIPVLEKSGLIVELDMYMMEQAFKLQQKWLDEGKRIVPISVNLSKMNFYSPTLVDRIMDCYHSHRVPAEMIEFEVTETVFFDRSEVIVEKISQIRELGFRVSVDDFGIGYSTLHMLGTMPVDTIKLDRGFVLHSIRNESGIKIFSGLIDIFKDINFDVICEGVETKEEEQIVVECGCNKIQGYLYDKPLRVDEIESKYMRKQ